MSGKCGLTNDTKSAQGRSPGRTPSVAIHRQAAAVSVDHPHVVERYRHGHQMVHGNGASGDDRTENLRKAMVDFRAVFEQLVEPAPEAVETAEAVER